MHVNSVKYFTVSIPGAGIFLPSGRATKRASPTTSSGSIPVTPTTDSLDPVSPTNTVNKTQTPPTPSLAAKFSQSVGPGRRAPSPAFRPRSRPSLPRPESPLRRAHNAPIATPGGSRPSLNMLSNNRFAAPRFAPSPTPSKMVGKTIKTVSSHANLTTPKTNGKIPSSKDNSDEVAHLKALLQSKDDKIATLIAEFESHRSDFRSTLDTLELASTETERVYEAKVDELLEERRTLMAQSEDVESVAHQLRQLEEVVQELEEGLEDARRGEAEARGEVEFLRGEVERVRAELRRERERNQDLEKNEHHDVDRKRSHEIDRSRSYSIEKESNHDLEVGQHRETNGANGVDHTSAVAESVDADKWCALCEQDGHDSISCPLDK